MKPSVRLYLPRFAAVLPAALWYRLIWGFSAQTADVSGTVSDGLLWRLLAAVSASFAGAEAPLQAASVEFLSFFERKAAHMFLYFILALLVYFALCPLFRRRAVRTALAALACGLLASLDEYHQTMVPGRSGELRDVLVDLCGAAVMLVILSLPALADCLRKRERTFPPAVIPAVFCVLPAVSALLPAQSLAGAPVLGLMAAERVPGAGALTPAELAYLTAELAPILRDVLCLGVYGLSGVCVSLAAGLAGVRFYAALASAFAVVAASGLASALFGASLPPAAIGTAGAGVLSAALLWGIASVLTRPAG